MSHVGGIHAVQGLLQDGPQRVRLLLLQRNRSDGRMAALRTLAERQNVRFEFTDKRRLDRLAGSAHQGVVAACHDLPLCDEQDFEDRFNVWPTPRFFLVADGIQDPRNLGACLRTAAAAGTQAVLLPKRRSAPLNAAALKVAAGAAERIALVEVVNLARRLQWLKRQGVWIVGTQAGQGHSTQSPNWTEVDLTRSIAIVVGNEGKGLRRLTREICDELVAIPMDGGVQSLNVAVAAGVLLFEAVRQRGAAG